MVCSKRRLFLWDVPPPVSGAPIKGEGVELQVGDCTKEEEGGAAVAGGEGFEMGLKFWWN